MNADVSTPPQAEALATRILMPREHPLVVVSTAPDGALLFDVDLLRHELDGIADVVTVATGPATKHLEQLLPEKTQIFNGAARSYPPDFHAAPDWHRSHLRFPAHADTSDLIHDAMAQTGRRTVQSAPAPGIRRASGTVEGLFADGSRAMVRLEDGAVVSATATLLPPDIPLAAALVPGGTVSGILEGQELHPEPLDVDLDAFPDGAHTLALVVKVTELRATVQLHPRVAVVLRRRDVDAGEGPVDAVLRIGDVIRVRVHRGTGGEVSLSLADADPDAPLTPSLALVTGGAPWLGEERPAAEAPGAAPVEVAPADHAPAVQAETARTGSTQAGSTQAGSEPAGSEPAGSAQARSAQARQHSIPTAEDAATRDDVAALSREVAALRRDMLALTNLVARGAGAAPGGTGGGGAASDPDELIRLRAENEQLRSRLADERAERASAEAKLSEASRDRREAGRALRDARRAAERSHVDASADGIRFEIERTWGNRTAPGERLRWPLREFMLGPAFIESLAPLDENQLSKAVRACVDAITGRDREIPARDLHRLRTGEGGDDPYVVRSDGARCWRSSIEQNTPGARRLHYWELPGGVIELGRVVLHDDMRP